MACKRIAAFTILMLLAGTQPAAALSGADIAGRVPQLLTAVSERNAGSQECTLGDAAADAVRLSLGADIAIVCGGDLVRNLLPGEITVDALKEVFAEDRVLASAQVSPKQLRTILEAGLRHITLDETEKIDVQASVYEGFPQVSGFMVSYDASAAPGGRVREIKIDGEALDLEDETTVLTLAATEHMFSGGYGLPAVSGAATSHLTLSGAFVLYINDGMTEYWDTGFRIYPVGNQNGGLRAVLPIGLAAVVIFLILLGNKQRFKHMYDFEP